MSLDEATGSRTYVVELPQNWQAKTDACYGSLELFLLRGELELGAAAVGAAGYVHLPQGCGGGELRSHRGALALVFWNPNLPCYSYPITRNLVLNSHQLQWLNSMPGAHGVMHKSLRRPDPMPHELYEGFDGGPGGYLRFQYIAPQMIATVEHVHHECWEEIILLSGDVLLVNEGEMAPGSVVSHPQEWYHAPFASRGGAVILVHTDGPMGYPWPPRAYPHGLELCERYLKEANWDESSQHTPWEQHKLHTVQETDPEYQMWRSSAAGCRWGDQDAGQSVPHCPGGRGETSRFRSQWNRHVNGHSDEEANRKESD